MAYNSAPTDSIERGKEEQDYNLFSKSNTFLRYLSLLIRCINNNSMLEIGLKHTSELRVNESVTGVINKMHSFMNC